MNATPTSATADTPEIVQSYLKTRLSRLEFQIVEDFDAFLMLKDEWNDLLRRSLDNYIFLRHEWFESWWNNFGTRNRLFIVIARQHGQVIGIAPLMIGKWRLRFGNFRCLKFIENDESPRCEFIIERNAFFIFPRLMKFILTQSRHWDLILLRNIPFFSATFTGIESFLSGRNFTYGIEDALQSPYIEFEGSWEEYLASLSKRYRRSIRQFRKKTFSAGAVTYEALDCNVSNFQEIVNTLFHIGNQSWKQPIHTDIGSGKERREFFRQLSAFSSFKKWLKIWVLRLDGKPIAFKYMLQYNDVTYLLRSEFDENFRDLSPGSTLQTLVIEHFFNTGGKQFDFCGGSEQYKRHWTKQSRPHKTIYIFAGVMKSKLLYFMEFYLRMKFKRLVRHERIKRVTLRLMNTVSGNYFLLNKLREIFEH